MQTPSAPFQSILAGALVALLGAAPSAWAVTMTNVDVDVFDASGPEFIAGDGIPINGFVQDSVPGMGNTVSVAVKARDRDTGQPNAIVGNRYYVDAGLSTVVTPGVSNLAFDYQFDPGASGLTNYLLELSLDFDPAAGIADFVNFLLPVFDADGTPDALVDSWQETDGFFLNPGPGAWSDDSVGYVVSNSTRMDFGFFSLPPFSKMYDPNAVGEYEIRLRVYDITGATQLASANAFAVVGVPEPSSLALTGLLGMACVATWRRRRNR
ncbi:hypothetical protein Pla175_37150 [Pirellulimonas nuda]|uniref:Uncharacterized protein n=1 Tax=Pirellulimonas nuda TaxID=2528009 RepID=A0A518DFV7_9BACT|nr:PEP-CTERM sorting domain-containing protein [Pirellulimonas nuda]QDU90312.1 hypothetical protein Pla175_37150 [Pirellulimonas nuda]